MASQHTIGENVTLLVAVVSRGSYLRHHSAHFLRNLEYLVVQFKVAEGNSHVATKITDLPKKLHVEVGVGLRFFWP